ncbi:chemotaxis protein CheB [Actinoplanes sp. GCM10030250]|uniref:chemotaxis protein CheB n=1 Tax=Actinoplanes sp. GCM10030250 TaxID=3273376 RepID=UPI00361D21AE
MLDGVRTPAAPQFDLVVLAASLGGPAALACVVAGLPEGFSTPVLIVQHRTPAVSRTLADTLQRRTVLPVRLAEDDWPADLPGITVLPARQTGSIVDGRLRLRAAGDPRTADPLIISAAEAYGPRAIGVVLTGRLGDGAAGLRAIKRHGGRTIVEDPSTAYAGDMPAAALATGCVDLVLPLPHIARALVAFTMAPGAADLLRVPLAPWAGFAA